MPDQPPPARFAFMPFGAGPRICVGAQFATTEAVLVLAAMIGRFRIARMDTRPVLPVGIVTTQPDHAAEVRLTVRRQFTGKNRPAVHAAISRAGPRSHPGLMKGYHRPHEGISKALPSLIGANPSPTCGRYGPRGELPQHRCGRTSAAHSEARR
jgi:hypothetical protein